MIRVRSLASALVLLVSVGAACGSPPPPAPPPRRPPPPIASASVVSSAAAVDPLAAAPPPGAPRPLTPAEVVTHTTGAGIPVTAIVSRTLPIVHVRFVVLAGQADSGLVAAKDRSLSGIAKLTAELVKDGGAGGRTGAQVAEQVDALGADLSVDVSADRTVFGLSVARDRLDAALSLLAELVAKPRLPEAEFKKARARELDRILQSQRGSGTWVARLALYRELFGPNHPYAEVDATPQSLNAITLNDIRAFHKRAYGTLAVYVAGDVDTVALRNSLDRLLAGMPKQTAARLPKATTAPVAPTQAAAADPAASATRPSGAVAPSPIPPAVPIEPTVEAASFPSPSVRTGRQVLLSVMKSAQQADILIGTLAVRRTDPRFAELALAVQALGGGMTSRLFADVREKRSLAYSTAATIREFARGPSVLVAYAGTQSAQAPLSVAALIENLAAASGGRPFALAEISTARSSMENGFLFKLETIGSVASLAIEKDVMRLPGRDVYDFVEAYRSALRDTPVERVHAMAREALVPSAVVISVAGDVSLAPALAKFGPVRVIDPDLGGTTVKELPEDPNAPLEVR